MQQPVPCFELDGDDFFLVEAKDADFPPERLSDGHGEFGLIWHLIDGEQDTIAGMLQEEYSS